MKSLHKYLIAGSLALIAINGLAQRTPAEDDYYKIISVATPEGILLEVGGVATLPDGRIALATRRGDVWIVENASMEGGSPQFAHFASGLHEALGLVWS